jgi:Tfp pilus assembly PilM family ATPase
MSTDYYMAQPGAQPPHELVLSGPGATRDGLATTLGERMGLTALVAEPLGPLTADPGVSANNLERHTVAAGLAMGAAG